MRAPPATGMWLLPQPAGLALLRLGACTAEASWTGARGFHLVKRGLRHGTQTDTHSPTSLSCKQEPEAAVRLVREAGDTEGREAKRNGRQGSDQQTLAGKVAETVVKQEEIVRPMHPRKKSAQRRNIGLTVVCPIIFRFSDS